MTGTLVSLSAGDGYSYLTRQVASHDHLRERGQGLADYYAEGAPAGRWMGNGIHALDVSGEVREDQMRALFGEGLHPDADRLITQQLEQGTSVEAALKSVRLGRKFPSFDPARADAWRDRVAAKADAIAERDDVPVTSLSREQRREARLTAGRELMREEESRSPVDDAELEAFVAKRSRPTPQPTAGYDATFTPAKSVSVLWALGDDDTRREIEAAHHEAVDRAVDFIEREVLFTRTGAGGVAQHETQGLIAAAFDHFDSRTGDPNLHTHVAISNKVQGPDDGWRSIDGRVMFAANVAYSEVYNSALEDAVHERLGVEFVDRDMGDGKRPVREIAGIGAHAIDVFSSRRQVIEAEYERLVAQYRVEHGHEPPKAAQIAMAQQATLDTRTDKAAQIAMAQQATLDTRTDKAAPDSLASKRSRWRGEAELSLGKDVVQRIRTLPTTQRPTQARHQLVDARGQFRGTQAAAQSVVRRVARDRATWRIWHIRSEAERQLRGVEMTSEERRLMVEEVTEEALRESVLCEAPDVEETPAELQRANGENVFRIHGSARYTSRTVLDAERRIVDAALTPVVAPIALELVAQAIDELETESGLALDEGQRELATAFAAADRQLVVGIGPAGSGKTQSMCALVRAAHRANVRVVALAPSAAAAKIIGEETSADRADTLAKVLHDLDAYGEDAAGIEPGDVVVVDEAGMAATGDLDRLTRLCERRGAVVRLLGDDQQLGAVAAGGVLRTVAHEAGAVRLTDLHRFSDPAEAAATLQMRDGDTAALGFYEDAQRIVDGDREELVDDMFTAWLNDQQVGRTSLMIAVDNVTVDDLARRAQASRVEAGQVESAGVELHNGAVAGVGDIIVTRRNSRELRTSDTDFVKNGDLWQVTARTDQGALTVRHGRHGRTVLLPAAYVAQHVELGYASTVNRAQGMTVDQARVLVDGDQMSRQQLYVAMTRGRESNIAYAITAKTDLAHVDHLHAEPDRHTRRGCDVLAQVLDRTDEASESAHEAIRRSYEHAETLGRLVPEFEHGLVVAHGQTVDQAVKDATRESGDVGDLQKDPAYGALRTRLIDHAARGHAPADVLQRAMNRGELASAHSAAQVLCHRVDLDETPSSAELEHPERPGLQQWLSDRRANIERRTGAVGDRAIAERPSWSRDITRHETVRAAAVYRDRYGITDTERPIGWEPERGTRQHDAWAELRHDLDNQPPAAPVDVDEPSSSTRSTPPRRTREERLAAERGRDPYNRGRGDDRGIDR